MTWVVVRQPDGSAFVEHHPFVRPGDSVVSRHETIREAREALAVYRDRRDREEAEAAGQMDIFGGGE